MRPGILFQTTMKQTMQKHWQAYRSSNPGQSPYMETDYKAGFKDCWKARDKQSRDHLYHMAYVSAMNALIQTERNCSPDHIAKKAVAMAKALVNEVYGNG